MNKKALLKQHFPINQSLFAVLLLTLVACQNQASVTEHDPNASRLAGTWVLAARISDDGEQPANQRILKLSFTNNGTFNAEYRGDMQQKWIQPGRGAFTYARPLVNLYWDSGAVTTLLVNEIEQDRILVHHGRNLVPLKDQEPDEMFQRQKVAKGPTKAQE